MVSLLIVMIMYFLFVLLFLKKNVMINMSSSYECGFESMSSARLMFSYRFFLVSILFIIFDVEICLMLPIPYLMMSEYGVWIFFLFLMVLLVGLIYEYYWGSLDWLNFYN